MGQHLNSSKKQVATSSTKKAVINAAVLEKPERKVWKRQETENALEQPTAFLRQRKTKEMRSKKDLGVFEKLTPILDLETFEDYPVINVLGGPVTPINIHARNLQDPDYDPSLSTEFWALEGMRRTCVLDQLPITHRNQVSSMEMLSLRGDSDQEELSAEEEFEEFLSAEASN